LANLSTQAAVAEAATVTRSYWKQLLFFETNCTRVQQLVSKFMLEVITQSPIVNKHPEIHSEVGEKSGNSHTSSSHKKVSAENQEVFFSFN